ncbi:hypothetical protein VSQ78_24860 [Nocardiopsis alba]|uniref:Uncharacterized protein n=1 Tax=Nocardiopsis alba TaxID=53437 RepID=A0ABV5E285_9ACTN
MADESDEVPAVVEREANRLAEEWRQKLERSTPAESPTRKGGFMTRDPETGGYVRTTRAEFINRSVERSREMYRRSVTNRLNATDGSQINSDALVGREEAGTPEEIAQAVRERLNGGGKA